MFAQYQNKRGLSRQRKCFWSDLRRTMGRRPLKGRAPAPTSVCENDLPGAERLPSPLPSLTSSNLSALKVTVSVGNPVSPLSEMEFYDVVIVHVYTTSPTLYRSTQRILHVWSIPGAENLSQGRRRRRYVFYECWRSSWLARRIQADVCKISRHASRPVNAQRL